MRNLSAQENGVVSRKTVLRQALLLAGLALLWTMPVGAQMGSKTPAQSQGQAQPPAQGQAQGGAAQSGAPAQNPTAEQPPASKEEDDAYRAFYTLTQPAQVIAQGEDFLAKYPTSRYRSSIYSRLVAAYMNTGDKEKTVVCARKALAENPDNADVLAIASTIIPRTITDARAIDADSKLTEAEKYARQAIELIPTLPKPSDVTDEQFTAAKNEKLGLAHFGLGLVYYMRGNPAAYVPQLEQSAKLDPDPEPLLFYLLGTGDMRLKNYTDAGAAFDRCATAKWDVQWQTRCKNGEAQAKQAATAPPAPAKP
jgi:tetratricopeptide (TPR) repeat protein